MQSPNLGQQVVVMSLHTVTNHHTVQYCTQIFHYQLALISLLYPGMTLNYGPQLYLCQQVVVARLPVQCPLLDVMEEGVFVSTHQIIKTTPSFVYCCPISSLLMQHLQVDKRSNGMKEGELNWK